jgi:acyl carrier protein
MDAVTLRPAAPPHTVPELSLYRLEWAAVAPVAQCATPRIAVLGAALGAVDEALLGALGGAAPVRVHADLASLDDALASGAAVPELVVASCASCAGDAGAVHDAVHRALGLVQAWLASERLGAARLVLVTHGAVGTRADEPPRDLPHAAVWGLVRSAQTENPDRFVLIDIDDHEASRRALPSAFASGEPQIAVREGALRVPRLARGAVRRDGAAVLDPDGTVLLSGATGGLGGAFARHLVTRYGAKHLLLVSRRGDRAPGSEELARDLQALGAEVTLAACDVADRGAVAALLDAIPSDRPLTAVVHAAAALDDGVLGSLTPERVDRVLRPKVDGALHLHELTAHGKLSAFVVFSSFSGTLGGAGMANYAAANAFLDALAQHRRALGMPAISLAWGLWEERGGMAGRLGTVDLRRMTHAGALPIATEDGLALFDAAMAADEPVAMPVRLDAATLAAKAAAGQLPAILRSLVRAPIRRASATNGASAADTSLGERLARCSKLERSRIVLDLIQAQIASTLGHAGGDRIGPERSFRELGFDSLMAVELRNRLSAAIGMRLPATLVFDYPVPEALARHLIARLVPDDAPAPRSVLDSIDALESAIADGAIHAGVGAHLGSLLPMRQRAGGESTAAARQLESASDDELFAFIDEIAGGSPNAES